MTINEKLSQIKTTIEEIKKITGNLGNDNTLELKIKEMTKEISKLKELKGQEINEAKKILAFEVTKLTRGADSAKEAEEIAHNIFNEKKIDERVVTLEINSDQIEKNKFTILDAIERLNLSKSRGDTKRLIKSKGIKINDKIYNSEDLSLQSYLNFSNLKISVGKKNIGILKIKN